MTEIVRFTPPSGGIDAILVALSQQDPVLPRFVYERLDPISRGPLTTWIGLRAQEEIPDPRSGAFSSLRDALGHAGQLGEQALTFALIGYPGRNGRTGPGGNEGRDRFLVAHEYLRIDHRRQEGVLVRLTEPDVPEWPRAQDWARLVETARPATPPAQRKPEEPPRYDWSPQIAVEDFARAVESLREGSGA